MAFLNLEKVGRDFTLSGKEFHNCIGRKQVYVYVYFQVPHFLILVDQS
jgi:hypothetical protein